MRTDSHAREGEGAVSDCSRDAGRRSARLKGSSRESDGKRNRHGADATREGETTKTRCRCGLQTLGPDPQRTTTTTDRSGVQKTFPARGVRRCNSAYCEGRRWKRDLNAAINIRRNLKHYLASADGRWMRFRQPLPGENAEAEDEDEDESDADEDGAAPQAVAPQPPAAAQQAPANTGAF